MKEEETFIGAFEAKTQLSRLLRETEKGRSFTIQKRGRSVARLTPVRQPGEHSTGLRDAFSRLRDSIDGPVSIRELVEDGRRY